MLNSYATTLRILSETAWMEASGEGQDGMHAVLSTIGKRLSYKGWMGTTFTEVCLKSYNGVHQFSCWNHGDPNITRVHAANANDPDLKIALDLARQLIAGTLPDITNGADSYYRIGSPKPQWATQERYRITIGHQAFYLLGLDGNAAIRDPLPPQPTVPTPMTNEVIS